MEICLKTKKVDKVNFAPFGEFHYRPQGEVSFECERFNWYDRITAVDLGVASFGMVSPCYTGKFEQVALEQHKNTKEIYIPLDSDIIIVVAKSEAFDKDRYNSEDFAAFHVPAGSMVIMNEGIWHEAPMTFASRANVMVIYRDKTGQEDKRLIEMKDCNLSIKAVL